MTRRGEGNKTMGLLLVLVTAVVFYGGCFIAVKKAVAEERRIPLAERLDGLQRGWAANCATASFSEAEREHCVQRSGEAVDALRKHWLPVKHPGFEVLAGYAIRRCATELRPLYRRPMDYSAQMNVFGRLAGCSVRFYRAVIEHAGGEEEFIRQLELLNPERKIEV